MLYVASSSLALFLLSFYYKPKGVGKMEGLLQHSKLFLKRNASTILTGIGGVGVIVTAVLAAKATPKAIKAVEEAKEEKGDDLTKAEIVIAAAPAYIPAAVMGMSTIACVFGANVLNKQHQAALMSAYALVDTSYKKYRGKLKELYGEEAHEKIVEAIAVEKAEEKYVYGSYFGSGCDLSSDERTGDQVLFYDEYSKRYFESTIEQVMNAEYHLNRNYVLRGYAVLNELYDFLGLEPTEYGSIMGWAPLDEGMYWIEFNHRHVVDDDGLEYYMLEMPFEPCIDYEDY